MDHSNQAGEDLVQMKPKATPTDILQSEQRRSIGREHMACPRNAFHGSRRRDQGYRGGKAEGLDDFEPVDGGEPPLEWELERYRRIPNPISTRESRNASLRFPSRGKTNSSSSKKRKRHARTKLRRR